MRHAPLLAICLGVLGGCSISSTSAQTPPSDSDTSTSATAAHYLASDFESDYASAVCAWYEGCVAEIGNVFASQDDCVRLFAFVAGNGYEQSNSDVDDPTLFRIDQAQAQTCLQAIKSTPCTQPVITLDDDACSGVAVGRLNRGECCDDRGGCAPGLVCEYNTSSGPQVGYCSAIGDIGETCYVQPCVDGASCQNVGGLSQCSVSLSLAADAPCDDSFDCGPGLACQTSSSDVPTTCLAQPDIGDFCGNGLACRSGLYCTGASGYVCGTSPGAVGQVCLTDSDCSSGLSCARGYLVCVVPGQAGAVCDPSDSRLSCAASLSCVNNVCSTPPVPAAIGDPCDPNGAQCPGAIGTSECVGGDSGYTCQLALQAGDACGSGDSDCSILGGLECDPTSKVCVSLPTVGQPCEELCAGLFSNACAADGTCKPRVAIGSPCTPLPGGEGDSAIFTECVIFALCLPDAASGQNLCTKAYSNSGEKCQ